MDGIYHSSKSFTSFSVGAGGAFWHFLGRDLLWAKGRRLPCTWVITHGACIGEESFGYEVAGSNKRETDGDVKVVFGIALYILVVCDRLCIAYIETRYLIVVEASCKP